MRTNDRLKSGGNEIPDPVCRSSVHVAPVLAVLDELAGLNINLHLLSAVEKVIFAVNLSWTTRSGGVCNKIVRALTN